MQNRGMKVAHGIAVAHATKAHLISLPHDCSRFHAASGKPHRKTVWIVIAAHTAIAMGTAMGGWRIVKTMGTRITKLRPFGGFCAETAGGITVLMATHLGVPVSTTHTITGAIVGVGASTRISAVRWGVAGKIVWAWVLTIPMSAAMAALFYAIFR